MKTLLTIALLSIIALPALADTPRYANGEEILDPMSMENCFEVSKNGEKVRFCDYSQDEKPIYEVNNDQLYKDCGEFGFLVDGECFTRNRDGRLFEINQEQN